MQLRYQFLLIQAMRDFFNEQGFMDVITPPMVENPGPDEHIHPFTVKAKYPQSTFKQELYLHSSPELKMKQILAKFDQEQMDKIFNINYVFRDEPHSSTHHHQFIMLEWYRLFATYEQILQDTKNLIASILENPYQLPLKYHQKDLQWHEFTIHELFQRELDINLAQFPKAHDLKHLIQNQFNSQISLPNNDLDWDDYFFLIFLNLIEPKLRKYPFLILKEYPASQASLSQINKKNNTCFRFEMYINGVEIANCFQEEINLEENINRFKNSNRYKMKNYGYQLPEPFRFYESIKKIKPCSGIALGVERLYMSLLDTNHIFFDRLL